jgi:hypothetical protein
LARRRRYRLDLFFFRLFAFSIAFLLAFSHAALLLVDGKQVSLLLVSCRTSIASATLFHRLHGFIMCRAPDRFVDFASQFILADPMKAYCQLRGLLCVHRQRFEIVIGKFYAPDTMRASVRLDQQNGLIQ